MPPNSALLTDTYTSPLRAQRGAAKRERYVPTKDPMNEFEEKEKNASDAVNELISFFVRCNGTG